MNTAIIITLIICVTIVILSVLNTIDKIIAKKEDSPAQQLKRAKELEQTGEILKRLKEEK